MAIHHASSGEVIDIGPLGDRIVNSPTMTLVKTDQLEIIRLMLPAGKEIADHKVAGPVTVQCLEGQIEFHMQHKSLSLERGQLIYLEGNQVHSLKGVQDASVLVTIQLLPRGD